MPTERFNQGQSSKDRGDLGEGELQQATGVWYKPGDPEGAHKQRGRTVFGDTGSGAKVKGVRILQYDSGGTDRLVALSGTTLYSAPPGATGTFASLKTSLDTAATRLSAAHYNDIWYLNTNGDDDRLFVVENDGTTRDAGMFPQDDQPAAEPITDTSTVLRPAVPTGDMTNGSNSMDGDLGTFGSLTVSSPGTESVVWAGWSGATDTYRLNVKYALQSLPIFDSDQPPSSSIGDTGATVDSGSNVTIKIEIAIGAVYTTVMAFTTNGFRNPDTFQASVGSINPSSASVRVSLIYNSGNTQITLRVYDVRLQTEGSTGSAFTTNTGFYYGILELDATRNLRSPIKTASELVEMASHRAVRITLPGAAGAKNSTATHWEIYRTQDGGIAPDDLGLIGTAEIDESTFIDDFLEHPSSSSPPLKYQMLDVTVSEGTIRVDRDQPPPLLDMVMSFKNSLIGIRGRGIRYALAALPESWPEIYTITSFNLEEHDTAYTGIDLGDTFVLGTKAAMMRIASLPRVTIGNFAFSSPEKIPGAPGCVGEYAMSKFALGGEPMAAWISNYGVYITNGFQVKRISDNWDWGAYEGVSKSNWTLRWDPDRFLLIMAYSTAGENNRYALFHMHPGHQRSDGMPKVVFDQFGSFSDLATAQVGNQRRLYSAHPSDGKVYLEDSGTTDASNAYSSTGEWPLIIKGRRIYAGEREFSALKAWLRHGNFGLGQTATVDWVTGRDAGSEKTRSQSVSLNGQQRTLFDVARSGEYHEITITHTGAATDSIRDLMFQVRGMGDAGKVGAA